uniref:Uncharacterized protein n=1 Tax=Anguilla anguilla TaxID=7936 RepID=A0A0E9Q9Z9_ANGAN
MSLWSPDGQWQGAFAVEPLACDFLNAPPTVHNSEGVA